MDYFYIVVPGLALAMGALLWFGEWHNNKYTCVQKHKRDESRAYLTIKFFQSTHAAKAGDCGDYNDWEPLEVRDDGLHGYSLAHKDRD